MRKLIATEWISLDGVVQGPTSPDEDATGGFDRGGWHMPYWDEAAMERVVDHVTGASAYLYGRGTYERFAAHWPNASPEEQVLAVPVNTRPKYVASTTLSAPLDWENSHPLEGDTADAVRALKASEGGDILVVGSPQLVQTLLEAELLDELHLMIDPVLVGTGKRLFAHGASLRKLRLTESTPTSTGALLATYVAA